MALTALTQSKFDIPLVFVQPVKQEQVQPTRLAKPQSTLTKPETKLSSEPDINRLMRALASQESGGNHELINGDSGASGKWQVMPENIPSWSRAALGRELVMLNLWLTPSFSNR